MPRILQQKSSVARKTRTSNRVMDIITHRQHPPTKKRTTDNDYNRMAETHKPYAHNAYTMISKASLIQYLAQAAFSPPKATLLKALHNNQFATWPDLTVKAVQKYLPESSPATDKGHTKQQKQGIRRTKDKIMTALERIETSRDMNPPMEKETKKQIFVYHAILEPKAGKIYVDYTVIFPIRSMEGNTAIFILYNWSSNAILATPVKK